MRVKRKLYFLVIFPLVLLLFLITSCSQENKYVGNYKFQLGKNNGTHFKIELVITDDDVKIDDKVVGKKFEFKVETSMNDESTQIDLSELTDEQIAELDFEKIASSLLRQINCRGYYTISEKVVTEGMKVLDIGITAVETPEIEVDLQDIAHFSITPDLIEQILFIEINEDKANVHAPVSLDDLRFQMYWYGIDSTKDGLNDVSKHAIGTHPSKEDVEEINKEFPNTHEGLKFRDYHTITMGLAREL